MQKIWTIIILILAALGLWTILFMDIKPSRASQVTAPLTMQCYSGGREAMLSHFRKWGETPILTGLLTEKSVVYLFRNKDNGDWSFVLLGVENIYCMVFVGEGLRLVKEKINAQSY